MRTVRFSAAISLDGYIADPKGGYDWIVMDPDIDFTAMFKNYDTMLMGRKSYDAAKGQGSFGMSKMPSYVFSKTLRQADCPDAIVSDNPKKTVAELKAKPGKDIWLFGGGELFKSMVDLRLVDEIEIAIIPVLLGDGLPMLPRPAKRAKLKLMKQKLYEKTGTILVTYAVK